MSAHVIPGLGQPSSVPHTSFRRRIRENPALHQVWRVLVFVAGLLCVAAGFALAVLPGPLTIPPVLLGLWIWSSEFAWAQRLFRACARQARAAWQHAKQHPVSSIVITVGGIAAVLVAAWAVRRFELVAQARAALGI
jgi:putative transmembrane protein PGPGW